MLSQDAIAALRRRTPHLPSGRLCYSEGQISMNEYNYSLATNQEIDRISKFIALTFVPYLETLELFGNENRIFKRPDGHNDMRSAGGSLYDLLIPLRTFRIWAIEENNVKREALRVKHVFSEQHLHEVLRMLAMVYEQERNADLGESLFLKQKALFGPNCEENECNIWVLYNMLNVAFWGMGEYWRPKFEETRNHDHNFKRLRKLTKEYIANETLKESSMSSQVFHALPLFDSRLIRGKEIQKQQERLGWHHHVIGSYGETSPERTVYVRHNQCVEVRVDGGHLYMTERDIPEKFCKHLKISCYGNRNEVPRHREIARLHSYQLASIELGVEPPRKRTGELTKLVLDANCGHFHAAKFLFSHALNGRIIPFPNPAAAWFPQTDIDGEVVLEHLNIRSLVKVVGHLLETSTGHVIFPVSGLGKWCYLQNVKTHDNQKFFSTKWYEEESRAVFAKPYLGYSSEACLVPK